MYSVKIFLSILVIFGCFSLWAKAEGNDSVRLHGPAVGTFFYHGARLAQLRTIKNPKIFDPTGGKIGDSIYGSNCF